jgi:hypothetical protein
VQLVESARFADTIANDGVEDTMAGPHKEDRELFNQYCNDINNLEPAGNEEDLWQVVTTEKVNSEAQKELDAISQEILAPPPSISRRKQGR